MTALPPDRLTVHELRGRLLAILSRRNPRPPTVITEAGAPVGLLLPYPMAHTIALRRGTEVTLHMSASAARGALGDLMFRAARLGAPTAITVLQEPRVAIAPLEWASDLPAPRPDRGDTDPEGATR